MWNKGFLLILIGVLILQCKPKKDLKPNVLLIMADDQGWGDLSIHGNQWVRTPKIDQLAKESKQFENFYVSPLCAPTRASLLTGRYHLTTGVVSVSQGLENMDADETTLGELFKANDYTTGIFGKWHNGQHHPQHPLDQGFDQFVGFCAGHWTNYFDTDLDVNGQMENTTGYLADILTNKAIDFITASKDKPFFCYVPFNTPHSPHQVSDKYFDYYKGLGLDDELAAIYGMVENMDDNIGRLLQNLEQQGLAENTIVIFLSDNGPNGVRFNGVLRGQKGSLHEGGQKVPFFIKWPNKIKPGIVNRPSAHIDVYPSLVELCGLKDQGQKEIHGKSFVPALTSEESDNRKIFTHVNFMQVPITSQGGGFRDDQYRFIEERDSVFLYDLTQDPSETTNIYDQNNPDHTTMKADYESWFTEASKNIQNERPILLGKSGAELPTYEAKLSPGVKFKEGHGWAHDWVAHWASPADSIKWFVNVEDSGVYDATVYYLASKEGLGSQFSLSGSVFEISSLAEGKPVSSPDRIKRKEVYEVKNWGEIKVKNIHLEAGMQELILKPLVAMKKDSAVQVEKVVLERKR